MSDHGYPDTTTLPRVRDDPPAVIERQRISKAVRGLFGQLHPMAAMENEPTRHDVVSRKAVLEIIDGQP